ncbi:hypothetical protein MKEN_01228000 [Mycena kentingensis (nom. inval.)]|nr:hypothetical protein MKEN_01228000 [Mycena kentingensis (nom. inval.)]
MYHPLHTFSKPMPAFWRLFDYRQEVPKAMDEPNLDAALDALRAFYTHESAPNGIDEGNKDSRIAAGRDFAAALHNNPPLIEFRAISPPTSSASQMPTMDPTRVCVLGDLLDFADELLEDAKNSRPPAPERMWALSFFIARVAFHEFANALGSAHYASTILGECVLHFNGAKSGQNISGLSIEIRKDVWRYISLQDSEFMAKWRRTDGSTAQGYLEDLPDKPNFAWDTTLSSTQCSSPKFHQRYAFDAGVPQFLIKLGEWPPMLDVDRYCGTHRLDI